MPFNTKTLRWLICALCMIANPIVQAASSHQGGRLGLLATVAVMGGLSRHQVQREADTMPSEATSPLLCDRSREEARSHAPTSREPRRKKRKRLGLKTPSALEEPRRSGGFTLPARDRQTITEFYCPDPRCGGKFSARHHFQKHYVRYHTGLTPNSKVCQHCAGSFPSRERLIQHQSKMSGCVSFPEPIIKKRQQPDIATGNGKCAGAKEKRGKRRKHPVLHSPNPTPRTATTQRRRQQVTSDTQDPRQPLPRPKKKKPVPPHLPSNPNYMEDSSSDSSSDDDTPILPPKRRQAPPVYVMPGSSQNDLPATPSSPIKSERAKPGNSAKGSRKLAEHMKGKDLWDFSAAYEAASSDESTAQGDAVARPRKKQRVASSSSNGSATSLHKPDQSLVWSSNSQSGCIAPAWQLQASHRPVHLSDAYSAYRGVGYFLPSNSFTLPPEEHLPPYGYGTVPFHVPTVPRYVAPHPPTFMPFNTGFADGIPFQVSSIPHLQEGAGRTSASNFLIPPPLEPVSNPIPTTDIKPKQEA